MRRGRRSGHSDAAHGTPRRRTAVFVAQDGRVRTAVSVARIRRRAADGADTLLRPQPRPWPAYEESVSRPHADTLQARHQRAYAPRLRVVTENARSRDHAKVTPAGSPARPAPPPASPRQHWTSRPCRPHSPRLPPTPSHVSHQGGQPLAPLPLQFSHLFFDFCPRSAHI